MYIIYICAICMVHQLLLVKHQLSCCVYISDPACCVLSIFAVCVFNTKHVHVRMYVCEFVPMCLQHLCMCACVSHDIVYVQIGFNHHTYTTTTTTCNNHYHIYNYHYHSVMQPPPSHACNNHAIYHIQPPLPHATATTTCTTTTTTTISTYHHHSQPPLAITSTHHHHAQPPTPHQPPPPHTTTTTTTTYNHHHHHHIQPPPPHNASNSGTTTCGSRVNVLVGTGKRPPVQVTEGQDHMWKWSIVLAAHICGRMCSMMRCMMLFDTFGGQRTHLV